MMSRASIYVLILATAAIVQPSRVAAQGTCNLLGEVFVTNPFEQTLMLKEDGSEDLDTIRFSKQTEFVRVTVERKPYGVFDPQTFQTGDRVCVQFAPGQTKSAARILVMKRLDIQQHQKQVFSALARNSSFGIVTELNTEKRTIELKEELGDGVSQRVIVQASDPVVFRNYSPDAPIGENGVATGW